MSTTARAGRTTPTQLSSKLGSYDEKANTFTPNPGPGHNAWQMTSAALVLFMTLPGLALFYGGLVRRKNVLSVMAQCLLDHRHGHHPLVGLRLQPGLPQGRSRSWASLGFAFLNGVDSSPNADYSSWVSHNVFAMYQLMFAIITPALIIGAIAERMKFSAILLFMTLWMFVVYFPQAHMIWGVDGMMNGVANPDAKIKAIDFAGGTVVHMTSGWSALILCLILGKRLGFGKENFAPHSMVLCMIGTGMLWVGWYGFNAGSAVAADVHRRQRLHHHHPRHRRRLLCLADDGMDRPRQAQRARVSAPARWPGLVVITPACGFVTPNGAVIIGICRRADSLVLLLQGQGLVRL